MAQTGPLAMSIPLLASQRFDGSQCCLIRTGNKTLEEGLIAQVLVVLLEVLLGGCGELHGDELVPVMCKHTVQFVVAFGLYGIVPSPLEACDDVANEATLFCVNHIALSYHEDRCYRCAYQDAIRLDRDEAAIISVNSHRSNGGICSILTSVRKS